jgi:hypothetical protein
MDRLKHYRDLVKATLREHAVVPYAHGQIDIETVFDNEGDHYLVLLVGRDGPRRVHGCLIHVDIINGKIWIQRDGTEEGVANQLVNVGVPKQDIVLGFQAPEVRPHTEFASA